MTVFDETVADRVSDRIIDALNAEIKENGASAPVSMLVGQSLALLGFLRTAPPSMPVTLGRLENALHEFIQEVTA